MSHTITKIPWITKPIWLIVSTLTIGLLIPSTFATVNALEVGENKTVFEAGPRLTRTAATNSSINNPSTYHFTIEVPDNAGEALEAVTISPRNNPDNIDFVVNKSSAFIGDSLAGGPDLDLADIGGASNSDDVTVVFEEPVRPGETVTVRLRARRNPSRPGVYLFGVTAFPEGENSSGLYLGSGRLDFRTR